MGKDPAFLFYPGDWLGGTLGMTFEEKGAYMELLMLQFNRGHMTKDMIGQTVGQLWVKLQDKFKQDDKGLWYNERLDLEKQKRKNFVSSRINNKKGKNQFSKNEGHMTSHMENENRNENVIEINEGVQGEKFSDQWFTEIFDSLTVESYRATFREHDLENEFKIFRLKVRGSPKKYQHRDTEGIRQAFIYQLSNSNGKKNGTRNGTEKTIRRADATIEAGKDFGQL